ncbi:DnaJ family domain-containing protein [Paenibacillus arenilitoris]|uniref:DUF1992 domain-containing protein n=1 Tax=Paenibacillus arenilitoris TaxID=2772299 RepID=A0A927CJA8_9BACL|nr:DUF1992 domain-containing protein [Paenibacillus arenilitoris]MBD2869129.1 DUF1992 domain-containing protein [Paenibacillus arenilitoris]
MFLWFKKKNNHFSANNEDHDTSIIEVDKTHPQPSDVIAETDSSLESDAGESAVHQNQYWNTNVSQSHWLDEMYKEQQKKGAFDHLPGKGKPLNLDSGDVFTSILKNANVLPDWLQLQQEIREQIRKLLTSPPDNSDNKWDQEIAEINIKIKKYNTMVPTAILQKRQVARDTIQEQYQQWL